MDPILQTQELKFDMYNNVKTICLSRIQNVEINFIFINDCQCDRNFDLITSLQGVLFINA